jgi:hypothetical protein
MAITMEDGLKNALLVELGSILSGGTLVILGSDDDEVATLGLSSADSNAINTPSGGSATFKSITSDEDITGGTAAKFEMRASGGAVQYSGTVTATGGGGDLTMASLVLSAGGTVTAGTITVSL